MDCSFHVARFRCRHLVLCRCRYHDWESARWAPNEENKNEDGSDGRECQQTASSAVTHTHPCKVIEEDANGCVYQLDRDGIYVYFFSRGSKITQHRNGIENIKENS